MFRPRGRRNKFHASVLVRTCSAVRDTAYHRLYAIVPYIIVRCTLVGIWHVTILYLLAVEFQRSTCCGGAWAGSPVTCLVTSYSRYSIARTNNLYHILYQESRMSKIDVLSQT